MNKYSEKAGFDAKPENQVKWTDTAAKVAYYLIFLLFIPAVLSALGIDGLSGPFEGMLASFFNFIPKLISAALVFAIGWFVAKLVRNLLEKLLHSAGVDRLADKWKLSSFVEGTSLSKIVGILAFVLIMIPVSITALEILDLEGISGPAIAMLNDVMTMLPKIFVAIVLVLVGIVAAKWVKDVVVSLLEKLGVNSIFGKMGFQSANGAAPSFATFNRDDCTSRYYPTIRRGSTSIIRVRLYGNACDRNIRLLAFCNRCDYYSSCRILVS